MDRSIRPDEVAAITQEAYVYAFPMLMGYRFAYGTYLQPASPAYKGPANAGPYGKAVPLDDTFRGVVTPNSDTPYSFALLDLRAGPVVISTPSITDRYYVLQFEDLYGFNELFVGSRATGTEAQTWFLMGPNYEGDVPAGFDGSQRFETELVFLIGRTQLLDAADVPACDDIMAQYKLEPYAVYAGGEAPELSPLTWPAWDDAASRDERFIGYVNALLPLCQPFHADDAELFARFARVGIGPGVPFDADVLETDVRDAMRSGVDAARASLDAGFESSGELINGWVVSTKSPFGNRAHYAGDYLLRAGAAMAGWGGNDLIEASYPQSHVDADGVPYDGNARYQLRLETEPPVRAFWSVTMYDKTYDGAAGYLVKNPIDRFLINSTTPELARDEDGSLTITMQREEPTGPRERANWLPTPDGPFYLTFRLYWPKPAALDRSWLVPGVQRVG